MQSFKGKKQTTQDKKQKPITTDASEAISLDDTLIERASLSPLNITPKNVQYLQRTIGNKATINLLNRKHNTTQAGNPTSRLQREFALPETHEVTDTEFTPRELRRARSFNNHRFNRQHTRTIQDVIGTEVTGRFKDEDIVAIAEMQESHGLEKDGRIGPETFAFLNDEMEAEELDTSNENSLISFELFGPDSVTPVSTPVPGRPANVRQVTVRGHFRIRLRFQERASPEDYEYRQFIQGTATGTVAGNPTNFASQFPVPGGGLPTSFSEDGDVNSPAVFYGHRSQPPITRTTATLAQDYYSDPDGTVNQRSGSVYKMEDYPSVSGLLLVGDTLSINVEFRGEVRRNGRVVQTRTWTGINIPNFVVT